MPCEICERVADLEYRAAVQGVLGTVTVVAVVLLAVALRKAGIILNGSLLSAALGEGARP